ncbi:hypothetical protein D9757_004850 [Collybiopsis confluens]|uniref:Uncharacterized protein n=1 Tax=Collybiopsis confluens TaxID=2823264 RepID=A0A8H5HT32_9AGAR|nr:hypothetical protein D9757_004850 [Collybiopsis confluens]
MSFKAYFLCCILLLCVFWSDKNDGESDSSLIAPLDIPSTPSNASPTAENTLAVILPVTTTSLPNLRHILQPIVHPESASTRLREILLVAQDYDLPGLRATLFIIMSQIQFARHVHCSIRSWKYSHTESQALVQAAISSSAEWLLILDEHGLLTFDSDTQISLLNPPAVLVPLGPRGIHSSRNTSCLRRSKSYQQASYLIPPFVMPKSMTFQVGQQARSWGVFGIHCSSILNQGTSVGGLLLPQLTGTEPDMSWCMMNEQPVVGISSTPMTSQSLFEEWADDISPLVSSNIIPSDDPPDRFGIIFSTIGDLEWFAPVACSLSERGHTLQIALYESSSFSTGSDYLDLSPCMLSYETLSTGESPSKWLARTKGQASVVITLAEMTDLFEGSSRASIISIPRRDLQRTSWMSSLTSQEWRDWNVPQVTLSVITKDRPQSLARLLASITNASYYGDQLDIRVNLEQSSDLATMTMVQNLHWNHGRVFVHHRVIHGGLLTAVAESWFPHSNDSYGVLLEDDVELSPLFYAWIKMTLLRYRYGSNREKHPQMFGISLYQPKNLELDITGRRPFNVSHILHTVGAPLSSPYLSQTPCSWGAVYFPEQWREFHDYLTMRFSESAFELAQVVVPNVRSNQWTRSWKKYFIELVYLRGYVMLYPNFPEYVSLSTNHLEVGSHVKVRSKEKREMFSVPLMKLGDEVDLLNLPDRSLPKWSLLPVLNLTGVPTTLGKLVEFGMSRYSALGLCGKQEGTLDMHSFC